MKNSTTLFVFIVIICYLIITFFLQSTFYTKELFQSSFVGIVDSNKLEQVYSLIKKYMWLNLITSSLIYPFITIIFSSTCIYLSFFLLNNKINFKNIFEVAVISQFIFLISYLARVLWYYFVGFKSLFELDVNPFSFAKVFHISFADPNTLWLFSLFNMLNLFEVIYLFIFAFFLAKEMNFKYKKTLGIVFKGYSVGMGLYCILISFLALLS